MCVRLVKTEMRKTEARLYAVSISEPPGAGPQPVGGAAFSFSLDKYTLCGGTWLGTEIRRLVLPAPKLHPSSLRGHKAKALVRLRRGVPPWRCTHRVLKEKPKQEKDYQADGAGSVSRVSP